MIKFTILIILGFILLIKGADIFVDGISSTSTNLKIPKLIISLTIVAFGTSTPELFISFESILNGNDDMVIANVVGSTIVNTMLIIGIAALIKPMRIKNETIKRQLPLHLIMISVFAIILLDEILTGSINSVTRTDAIILLLIFIAFLIYILRFNKKRNLFEELFKEKPKWNLPISIFYSVVGLILIYFGSEIAVNNCVNLAHEMHVSEKIITMVVLVIGTSAPELVMAINSAKKGEFDIILGNIIGTNIFNIGFVLALPIIVFGTIYTTSFNFADMFVMTISGTVIYLFAKDDKKIDKTESIVMLSIFIIYYLYILVI